jgi:hypothetical protein
MAAPASPPVVLPPSPSRPRPGPPTVPPPGATQRSPDGRWWRWDGRGWVLLPDPNRGAGTAQAGVIVGIIQLLWFTPLGLIGLADGSAAGVSPGAFDVLVVLVLTAPAIVLGAVALAARPGPKVRGEAVGAIVIGSFSTLALLAAMALAAAS